MKNIYRYSLILCLLLLSATTYGQLIINEIHADPAGDISGDANGDGVRDASDDEFVELVNTGGSSLDISGWKIFDTNSALLERHVFPAATIVPAGGVIVVFGGGVPAGFFGGAIVQTATSGALGLTNTSETVIIEDGGGTEMISYTYADEANNDQSITRDPDVTGPDNPMILHTAATGSTGALFSPGTKTDGSLFIPENGFIINEIYADPASDITGDANGDGVRSAQEDEFVEFVNTASVELDISGWKFYDTYSEVTERHVFPSSTIIPAGGAIIVFGGGTPTGAFGGAIVETASSGELGLTNSNDSLIVENADGLVLIKFPYGSEAGNDQSITRDPDITGSDNPMVEHSTAAGSGGTLFSPGTKIDGSPFGTVAGLIINEIHADPASDITGDANGDGSRSAQEDEFIEFINTGPVDLDISDWKFYDTYSEVTERHVFPSGTIVPAGGAIVVFGGGSPTGTFGGAIVQTASSGELGLTNSNDSLVVEDAAGTAMIKFPYGSEAGNDQSITRDPDITGSDDPMVEHAGATGSGGALFSPGTKIDGTPFIEIQNTLVQFSNIEASVNEGDGTYNLEVSIISPDNSNATSVDVVLSSGNADDINGFATQTITFPAGDSENQVITIDITDDTEVEAEETLVFELQNVTGGNNAELGSNVTSSLIIQDNDFATSSLIINEYMAWPAGAASSANGPEVDTNGDGVSSFNEDEFIEFVNNGNVDLDISGWKVYDTYTQLLVRHEFPGGTVINPGGALVVFGGGSPVGEFGGAQIQVSSEGDLGLTNTNDEILVKNKSGETVISVAYGEQTRGTSITLNPDISGAIGPHPDLNGSNFSPGTMVDGTPFNVPTRTTVQFASPAGGINEDGGQFAIELSITRPSDINATTAEVIIPTSGYESDLNYTATTITFPAGSAENQTIMIDVLNDEELEGDELFELKIQNVSGGSSAIAGSPSTFAFSVLDDDVPLIFNEVHADPASDISGDANNDGVRDPAGDEFIEIVNRSMENVDMSGFKFYDASELRHVFSDGTILEPGRALVVFGGGIPVGTFGGSEFQIASEGSGLSLTNTGDELKILNTSDQIQAALIYGNLADNDQSITRSPDITGGFALHSTVEGAEGRLYSPGTKNDGGLFINIVSSVNGPNSLFKLYPNPSSDKLIITFQGESSSFLITIIDNKGSAVLSQALQPGIINEVNLSHLRGGIYHYQLYSNDSNTKLDSGKLLIQR